MPVTGKSVMSKIGIGCPTIFAPRDSLRNLELGNQGILSGAARMSSISSALSLELLTIGRSPEVASATSPGSSPSRTGLLGEMRSISASVSGVPTLVGVYNGVDGRYCSSSPEEDRDREGECDSERNRKDESERALSLCANGDDGRAGPSSMGESP